MVIESKISTIGLKVALIAAGAALWSCHPSTEKASEVDEAWANRAFVHDVSDLPVDLSITYGVLPNGLRYAVRSNDTPSRTASLLMRFDAGSLDETDATRGLAHFLEHMAFNGSDAIPEGEMIKRLERLGLAFGPDTNASTGFDQTVYQLELPDVTDELLSEALMIFRETAENLTLDPDAIDRERGIILAEKRSRNSPNFRAQIAELDFQTSGSGLVESLPIGTEETIQSVSPAQFEQFYREQYRPEDTFIVLVGDRPVEQLAALIESAFADWEGQGEGVEDEELGDFNFSQPRFGAFFDPEITSRLTLSTISNGKSDAEKRDTAENRAKALPLGFAQSIMNRRLAKAVRDGTASYTGAGVGIGDLYGAAQIASLSVGAETQKLEQGFIEAERELRRAIEHGFTQDELDEQIANTRKSLEISVQTAPTRRTSRLARSIIGAFAGERVITTAETTLERFNATIDSVTIEAVNAAFRDEWVNLKTAPQLYLRSDVVIEEPEAFLENLIERSQSVSLPPQADRDVGEFAYSDWGPAGTIASRGRVEDIGITTIIFENGVRLNLKATPYEEDVIRTRILVGAGSSSYPQDDPAFSWKMSSILNRSGLEAHTVDDLQTLMAGRAVGVSRGFGFESMSLSGSTVPVDFALQMKLMTAYLTAPAYRESVIAPYANSLRSVWETIDSTPARAASLEVPALLSSGHWLDIYPSLPQALDVDLSALRAWYAENIEGGPLEISVVGDFDDEAVISAVAESLGTLPPRRDRLPIPSAALNRAFPDGQVRPVEITHAGEPDTALLRLYWPVQGHDDIKAAREIRLLSSVMDLELTEALREEEGATYSPSSFASLPPLQPQWGYLGVSVEASPDELMRLTKIVEDIAARLAREGVDEDVFDRAIQPTLENLETSLENNGYWMNVIDQAQSRPDWLAYHRTREAMYQSMTADDIARQAAKILIPEAAIRVHVLPEE